MPTETPTKPTTGVPDFDALEADLEKRIGGLHGRRQALALDALTDAAASKELATIEVDLSDAEAEVGRLALARAELERREIAARAEAESAAQAAALDRARDLQVQREVEAKRVDAGAQAFVGAAQAYVDLCDRQANELQRAGRPQAAMQARSVVGYRIEAALASWMRVPGPHRQPRFLERIPLIREPHKVPLIESELAARPIAPKETNEPA